ncbi:MAG TPA: magnesium transporter CorA family protein [Devosiaceae bacterium]|nr:magnesium transporter CorA family protein [Devosiaceae bacterium]
MLRMYARGKNQLIELATPPEAQTSAEQLVWIDMVDPSPAEDRMVEQLLGLTVPSRAEMEEIELSSRLYSEGGAEFMTLTALASLDTDEPIKTPVTFILKGPVLVTVRYAEPKPFLAYVSRATRTEGAACDSGELVMLGIIEAMIDRTADALEIVGNEVDKLSRSVFRQRTASVKKQQRDLEAIIQQVGRKSELLTMVQESLVSIVRLIDFHGTVEAPPNGIDKGTKQLRRLINRDASSLGEHARALSGRLTFLLDATLGLINLQQNQIIKIVSVAALVFLPPTLVASVYGMNFHLMPELDWSLGYPVALLLMLLSAILPYLFFRGRGWL